MLDGHFVEEMDRQGLDVFHALAEGNRLDGDHVQTIKQVQPETPAANLRGQVAVGRHQNPYIDRHGPIAADRHHRAFLDGSQQFGLQVGAQLANFIQEDGAPLCRAEAPNSFVISSGEGPFDVAKKMAGEQLGGECSTVDRDEGLRTPRTVSMDGTSNQFFSRAAWSRNQHAARKSSHPRNGLPQRGSRRTRQQTRSGPPAASLAVRFANVLKPVERCQTGTKQRTTAEPKVE